MPIIYDRDAVYAAVREPVFSGRLSASQEAGIDAILTEWEAAYPAGDARFIAYMLATPAWETARKMRPVKEYGGEAYFTRMYDIHGARPSVARMLGNTEPGDGARFCGRGLPQTTGRKNYAWASTVIGLDCVANPDLLLEPKWACKVMFAAMIGGKYTGKKLSDYFNDLGSDWIGARRIVNGSDHAVDIAAYGRAFFAGLQAGMKRVDAVQAQAATPTTDRPVPMPAAPGPAPIPPVAAPTPAPSLLTRIASFFGR